MKALFHKIEATSETELLHVILDVRNVSQIDATAAQVLPDIHIFNRTDIKRTSRGIQSSKHLGVFCEAERKQSIAILEVWPHGDCWSAQYVLKDYGCSCSSGRGKNRLFLLPNEGE